MLFLSHARTHTLYHSLCPPPPKCLKWGREQIKIPQLIMLLSSFAIQTFFSPSLFLLSLSIMEKEWEVIFPHSYQSNVSLSRSLNHSLFSVSLCKTKWKNVTAQWSTLLRSSCYHSPATSQKSRDPNRWWWLFLTERSSLSHTQTHTHNDIQIVSTNIYCPLNLFKQLRYNISKRQFNQNWKFSHYLLIPMESQVKFPELRRKKYCNILLKQWINNKI